MTEVGEVDLTNEQLHAVQLAETGHNLCIFGRAGTGKTAVVKTIKKKLTAQGMTCQIVCSSGISCDPYGGTAKTVHSHYGLQTAERPDVFLLERALSKNDVCAQISRADVLIWDEISMSSRRIFEIVNMLHHSLSGNTLPFGGIQVLLVGDFLQLKPIPTPSDLGQPIYLSPLFKIAFPHRVELKNVMRQGGSENKRLKEALDQLRVGQCDEDTETYLCSLEREVETENNSRDVLHIYYKKLPAEIHNLNVLSGLPGQLMTFESSDSGYAQLFESTVSRVLALKSGCNVMLLYNINSKLKNGYRGEFIGICQQNGERNLLASFPEVGSVVIERRTWYKYDANGKIVASRTQFPLVPCYATTVHKAQGLSLDKVVVHCSQEFVPGQTYVAVSRVREEAGLRVIGFKRRYLILQADEGTTMMDDQPDYDPGFDCCKNVHLDNSFFGSNRDVPCQDDECENSDNNTICGVDSGENIAREFFETNKGVPNDLEDVLLCTRDFEDSLSAPPAHLSMNAFLDDIKSDKNDDPFSKLIKVAACYATDHLEDFIMLAEILWCRIVELFKSCVSKDGVEIHVSNQDFTRVTTKLHQLFLTQAYRSDLISAFHLKCWSDLNDGQRSLGMQLVFHIYKLVIGELSKLVHAQEAESVPFNVSEMGPEGRGKVRYIGGWVIRKSLEKSRRYVNENKLSQTKRVREKINDELVKIALLENNMMVHNLVIQASSTSPETLNVVESRQYRENGLIHITDGSYEFFLALEQRRIDNINASQLMAKQVNLINEAMDGIMNDEQLRTQFVQLFSIENIVYKEVILELFKEAVTRYLKMGAGQFLRDFRRDYRVRKSIAHRKLLSVRREKAQKKQMKVLICQLEQDKSQGKRLSHVRLLAIVEDVGSKGMEDLYTKEELRHLCAAYNVRCLTSWNKNRLADALAEAIKVNDHIPRHELTSTYAVETVQRENNPPGIPVLKIRRI